jgi:hypothetical protein
MGIVQSLKKLLLSDNPPDLFFCIRKKHEKIEEVYCVYNVKDHLKEKVYTLKETVKILEDYKNNQ